MMAAHETGRSQSGPAQTVETKSVIDHTADNLLPASIIELIKQMQSKHSSEQSGAARAPPLQTCKPSIFSSSNLAMVINAARSIFDFIILWTAVLIL